ncbi:MAG: hypothetical protein HQ564_08755 [Candidatus Saganbacteria bacterium]|nr:hypothetical protein [Candidatus Saganbacteria bacterium]
MHPRIETIINGILKTKRIANAYLFIGPPQSGKFDAALSFAKSANNIEKETHPDLIIIEKEKTTLKIDQIRRLKDTVKYGPNQADFLFAIIKDAETMTIEAANSFLKCLEEPPPRTIFILLCTQQEALPKTIASRCQRILFPESSCFSVDETAQEIYNHIGMAKSEFEMLSLTKTFTTNEELLNSLIHLYHKAADSKSRKSIRVLQEIGQGIKRRGNKNLAADIMMIRLNDIWNKN